MTSSLALRVAAPADAHAIARLAALDSSAVPAAPLLVAERDGALVAAISIPGGDVIADPFELTADVVDLLQVRRRHAGASHDGPRRRRSVLAHGLLEQPAQLA